LDLSSFDTSKVIDMSHMFSGNTLNTLDLSNFDTSNLTNMVGMFRWMSELNTLDIRNATFDSVKETSEDFDDVPKTVKIYVKDNTAKAFIQSIFDGTNIIIP